MAGLTPEGLVIKTLPEIFASLTSKLEARYGNSYQVTTNTPEGFLVGIMADELSDLWEAQQQLYDGAFPNAASARNLDNVCSRVYVERIPQSKTSAILEFTGTVGATIPEDTVVTVNTTEDRFLVASTLVISLVSVSKATITLVGVVDSTDYTVTLDAVDYTFNSGVGATESSILTGLAEAVNIGTSEVTATVAGTSLNLEVNEVNSTLPLTTSANLLTPSVSSIVTSYAEVFGEVVAPLGQLQNLLVPIAGVTSVVNREAGTLGREEETDEELRVRRYLSVQSTGSANYNALLSRVRGLSGVTSAFVIANSGASVNSEGVPSKAFEFVIEGGDEDVIAQTIHDNQPISIESFGAVSKVVTDIDGNPQTVRFSRPTPVYIHVNLTYKIYTEEVALSNLTNAIRQGVLSYGDTLSVGTDIIPERFFGSIYAANSGVGKLSMSVAKSYDAVTVGDYTTDILSVSKREKPTFRINLISVLRV